MAAGITSPSTPRVERVQIDLAYVASDTQPRLYYRVRPASCTCYDWEIRGKSEPGHRCKHMQLAFPIRCTHCDTNQVPVAGELCGWCAEDLNEQAKAGVAALRTLAEDPAQFQRALYHSYVCEEHDGAVGRMPR